MFFTLEEYMKKTNVAAAGCAAAILLLSGMTGCSKKSAADNPYKGTITFSIWDNNLNEFIEKDNLVEKFHEKYPEAELEIEKMKDDSEYWNSMKIRASARQLPDVMFNKPFTLTRFKDYLLDMSGTEADKNNMLADSYKIDGKVLGIPLTTTYEYVFYWKDMFAAAGVKVPQTWSEFEDVAAKLQAFYGKTNPDFMALACGLKDEWPDYPYMEFGPALEGGNGHNWNTMASQDAPFAEGTDIYKCYHKIYDLFTSGALGKDPLGLGYDQASGLFAAKKAAIMATGDWGLQGISQSAGSTDQLGTFYLPLRNTTSDPYNVITQGDSFMGVTTHSKHPELAKAFVEWFFSEEVYPDFIAYNSSSSSMKNFSKEKDPILAEADTNTPDKVLVMYDGAGDDFTAIQNETAFDYKKLGAEMLTPGFDLDKKLNELNGKWKAARTKLNIK